MISLLQPNTLRTYPRNKEELKDQSCKSRYKPTSTLIGLKIKNRKSPLNKANPLYIL
jgi:hypothetical protein